MSNIVIVSIGRNVGIVPMSDEAWTKFQSRVNVSLTCTVGRPDFVVVGQGGVWGEVPEESAVFTVLGPDLSWLPTLRAQLTLVAWSNKQDAIALTVGDSELIEP